MWPNVMSMMSRTPCSWLYLFNSAFFSESNLILLSIIYLIGIGGFEHQWSLPLLPPPENTSERDKLDKVGQLWDSCLGQIWYRWGNSCPPFLFILGNSVFADFFIEIKWTLLYIYFFENIDFEIRRLGGAKRDHPNTISCKIHKKNSIRLKIGMYILDVFLS